MAKEAGIEVDVEWEGLDALIAFCDEMSEILGTQVKGTMHEIGADASRLMETATPVRTGYLRSRNKLDLIDLGFILSNDAEYAKYVNWGTSRQPAQNFLETAVEYARMRMKERLPKVPLQK